MRSNGKGKFIVFEGIDGSGKSTQIKMLRQKLRKKGIKTIATKEPTDGPIGAMLRQILSGRMEADYKVIAALFLADRIDHLVNKNDGIIKHIESGTTVICDRYYLSSYAYQSDVLSMEWLLNANSVCADMLKPTCHIFIDIDPEVSLERVTENRSSTEIYENIEKLRDARNKYLKCIDIIKDRETIIKVDGSKNIRNLSNEIWDKIEFLFK